MCDNLDDDDVNIDINDTDVIVVVGDIERRCDNAKGNFAAILCHELS